MANGFPDRVSAKASRSRITRPEKDARKTGASKSKLTRFSEEIIIHADARKSTDCFPGIRIVFSKPRPSSKYQLQRDRSPRPRIPKVARQGRIQRLAFLGQVRQHQTSAPALCGGWFYAGRCDRQRRVHRNFFEISCRASGKKYADRYFRFADRQADRRIWFRWFSTFLIR